jgi:hypothetical protein
VLYDGAAEFLIEHLHPIADAKHWQTDPGNRKHREHSFKNVRTLFYVYACVPVVRIVDYTSRNGHLAKSRLNFVFEPIFKISATIVVLGFNAVPGTYQPGLWIRIRMNPD